jgi:hypothetical protein
LTKCLCAVIGKDGTKNHTEFSGIALHWIGSKESQFSLVLQQLNPVVIFPCMNHLEHYASNEYRKITPEEAELLLDKREKWRERRVRAVERFDLFKAASTDLAGRSSQEISIRIADLLKNSKFRDSALELLLVELKLLPEGETLDSALAEICKWSSDKPIDLGF